MRRRRGGCSSLLLAAFVAACGLLPGQAQAQEELRRVFEQILQNPNDPELNFRYARLAEEKELLRKALGAYERILLNDPDNEEAKAGLRRKNGRWSRRSPRSPPSWACATNPTPGTWKAAAPATTTSFCAARCW